MEMNEPITEAWLVAHGWRLVGERNDERTQPSRKMRRLAIAAECLDWPQPFRSSDDLCIDVAPWRYGEWFVWIHQEEPYRFVPVRMMKTVGELVRLWEGLTGKEWSS